MTKKISLLFLLSLTASLFADFEIRDASDSPVEGYREATYEFGEEKRVVYLGSEVLLSSKDIEEAYAAEAGDSYGVYVNFTEGGSRKLRAVTAERIGEPLAFIVDEQVLSVPRIMDTLSKNATITGFPKSEAEELAKQIMDYRKAGPSAVAEPIDLSEGYHQFKWGMNPDALLVVAKEHYGEERVWKRRTRAEGADIEIVAQSAETMTTTFEFYHGAFYKVTRENDQQLSDFYTSEDIDIEQLEVSSKQLYSSPEGIRVNSASSITSKSGRRVNRLRVTVTITNEKLLNEVVDDLRSKSPDIREVMIEPFKTP